MINAVKSWSEFREKWQARQNFERLKDMLERWYAALTSHGFSWSRSERAMFLSGPHSHTNYHFDSSYVLAWQIHGRKRFCFTKDPERWCNADLSPIDHELDDIHRERETAGKGT